MYAAEQYPLYRNIVSELYCLKTIFLKLGEYFTKSTKTRTFF